MIRLSRLRAAIAASVFFLGAAGASRAQTLKAGDRLGEISVGKTTYREVQIRAINSRTAMITHTGGMASLPLRELSPELQSRFGYDPAAETRPPPVTPAPPPPIAKLPPRTNRGPVPSEPRFDTLLRQFGQPAIVAREVNLRPRFVELGLGVRDQGARPSCAIFAIVCALEFQAAQLTGKPQALSEEYLLWAARKTTQRAARVASAPHADAPEAEGPAPGVDEGFLLSDVVVALRAYGVPPVESVRGLPIRKGVLVEPPPELVEEARRHQRVAFHALPGRDAPSRITNIIHALNAGVPVSVGVAWPHYRTLRSGNINAQKPVTNSWHAVTIVGYRSATGTLEDTQFIFKNSWGSAWGQGGYGTVTYGYLAEHLNDAVLLEVARAGSS
jgi:hypothetical protein